MAISDIKLFFTRLGGRDVPATYDWNKPFGFDVKKDEFGMYTGHNIGSPLYKYSLMDVLNAFNNPISYVAPNSLPSYKNINNLLIFETDGNEQLKQINISTTFWKKVIRLLELIFENQDIYIGDPIGGIGSNTYTSRGDQILSNIESDTPDEIKDVAGNNGIYNGGLKFEKVTFQDKPRASKFHLKLTRSKLTPEQSGEDNNLIPNDLTIDIYVEPMYFIVNGIINSFAVYSYEDLATPSDKIDDALKNITIESTIQTTEFDAAIIYKLNELLNSGKYKSYIRYCPDGGTTFYINQGIYKTKIGTGQPDGIYVGEELVTSENQHKYGYNKPFYIFTKLHRENIGHLTLEMQKEEVGKYIRNVMFAGGGSDAEMRARFPNFFSDSVVEVYPILRNKYKEKYVHPLSGEALDSLKKSRNIKNDSYYEVFSLLLGTEYHGGNKNLLNLSYLAIERTPKILSTGETVYEDGSSIYSQRPITLRFPTFMPDREGTTETLSPETKKFHHLCSAAVAVLLKTRTLVDIINSINMSEADGSNNKFGFKSSIKGTTSTVSFTYDTTSYIFIADTTEI